MEKTGSDVRICKEMGQRQARHNYDHRNPNTRHEAADIFHQCITSQKTFDCYDASVPQKEGRIRSKLRLIANLFAAGTLPFERHDRNNPLMKQSARHKCSQRCHKGRAMCSNGLIHATFQHAVDQCIPTLSPEIRWRRCLKHWISHRDIRFETGRELHHRRHGKSKKTKAELEHICRKETVSQMSQPQILHRQYPTAISLHFTRATIERLEIAGSKQDH
mmetsp:Transcript_11014/g.18361  ORF Transcript_11014/g.18361 Transcript_11014/m.18361 type:complete len:219 (-) Transcript_11014:120-776(-)